MKTVLSIVASGAFLAGCQDESERPNVEPTQKTKVETRAPVVKAATYDKPNIVILLADD